MPRNSSFLPAFLLPLFLLLATGTAFAGYPDVKFFCDLGATLYHLERYDESLDEFNRVLELDPKNKLAKEYVGNIFKRALISNPPVNPKAQVFDKGRAIDQAMAGLQQAEPQSSYLNDQRFPTLKPIDENEERLKAGPLKITGEMQLSFGVTPDDFIWKRANFDLNEKFKSWRMTSDAGFNKRFNTYDPRIYDSLSVNLDTDNKEGFNFHSNVTVDPWSFTGRSDDITLSSGADTVDVQLRYWSNTGYVVNNTLYTNLKGVPVGIPELKVVKGKTSPLSVAGFNIPEMKITRQFQPLRELWLDYANDQMKLRVFPMAYQDQAYTSDDPLNITNRHIWWQDSPWLRRYTPGNYNSGSIPVNFTKGLWNDQFSFITKDSTGKYLTALRGLAFNFQPQEETSFDTTLATPKDLWQNYTDMDNVISASRFKQFLLENLLLGVTFTTRLGFKTDPDSKLDSQNYVGGMDLSYEIADGLKAQAEVLTSKSYYDTSNSDYKTETRGSTYYFSFLTRYPRQSIMDLKTGYDEIKLDKSETFLIKSKFYLAHMDKGFDQPLSNFHNTRQDTFWSRHIHFRKPFEYYFEGLEDFRTGWDALEVNRIGDGIDNGRDVIGFRLYTICLDKYENLFDVRNVHNVNGKFIENVVRDELTLHLSDKLTAKGLGIYHKLPRTLGGVDPFVYSGNTGEFWLNDAVSDGENCTLKTGSFGLNYDFFNWLSVNGIYERTNDYSLAYGDFPRNVLRDDTNMNGTYYQNEKLYRESLPFLYDQKNFPQAPYSFFNVFKVGGTIRPLNNMEIYLDYTRNEFEIAGQNSDNMNHIGTEIIYMPFKKMGLALRYTYSRWQDVDRLQQGITKVLGHHNFFSEFRYLPSKDDELILQYGEGNTSPIGNMTLDPYGGSNLTIDTQHIIRAYYRRKF